MNKESNTNFELIYVDAQVNEFSPMGDGRHFVDIHDLLKNRQATTVKIKNEELVKIQINFHNLIRYRNRNIERIQDWLKENESILPVISTELLNKTEAQWFSVAGMYGGFSYGLFVRDGIPTLVTDSWIRIVGGSGEQHEITLDKVELVARGFV